MAIYAEAKRSAGNTVSTTFAEESNTHASNITPTAKPDPFFSVPSMVVNEPRITHVIDDQVRVSITF
jgi:hypothetical protein